MANPNISEIVTATLENRSRIVADAVSKNNGLLRYLRKRGNVKPFSGGATIRHEIAYAETSGYTRYSGYDFLSMQPSDVLTSAEFSIKQVAVPITISGLEQLQNSGPDAILDLLEERIQNGENTMMNNMSTDIYSDGTADGGKQIGGLQLLVPDDPTTGTAGGISRATHTFWRSKLLDHSVESLTPGSSTIQQAMNLLYLRCARGTDVPDLIVFDNTYYNYFWTSLQALQRFSRADDAELGFVTLRYMGADVIFDGGNGGACPQNHGYFINTKYLFFRPHRDRNFVPLKDRFSTNQDAMVRYLAWAGNLTANNLAVQGVMIN